MDTPISLCAVGAGGPCSPGSGDLTGVIAISTGEFHSMALLSDRTIVAFGWNAYSQLGDGTSVNTNAPIAVAGISAVRAISAAGFSSVVLLDNGEVWGWGWNDNNELAATADMTQCSGRDCNRSPVRAGPTAP